MVIGTFLSILGVPREWIVEEFLLSDGNVCRQMIESALDGITPVEKTFAGVNLARVRLELQGTDSDPRLHQ